MVLTSPFYKKKRKKKRSSFKIFLPNIGTTSSTYMDISIPSPSYAIESRKTMIALSIMILTVGSRFRVDWDPVRER